MLKGLAISIIAIHFCLVLPTLTSPNFKVFWIGWPTLWQSHLHLLARRFRQLCFHHWLRAKFRIMFRISLLTYITLHEDTACLSSLYAFPSLPSYSLRPSKGISLLVPGSRTTQAQELFTLVLRRFGTPSRCLSIQPLHLQLSGNVSKHISLTWPFPHKHKHARWPINFLKLLHRFWF